MNKDVMYDCQFLKENWKDDRKNGCIALNVLYCCRGEKCGFYKPKETGEREHE